VKAPPGILKNYVLGRLAGIVSRVKGRQPNPLAVLARVR